MAKQQTRKGGPVNMSDDHKAALAAGREEGRIVRSYLEALASVNGPKRRGRKPSSDRIVARLAEIESELESADALRRLQLVQERLDLEGRLAQLGDGSGMDFDELEQQFINIAADYASRKGISYAAFREIGVPSSTLKAAGITRR